MVRAVTKDSKSARKPSRPQTQGGLDAAAKEFHRALSELIRVYQFRDRDRICCHGISVTQCYALGALVLKGPLGLTGLSAELYLDKSTTSRVIDALERKGCVRRREDPADRRAVLVVATDSGERLHARIEREILAQERELLAAFDPEVRASVAELIGKLAAATAARVETDRVACTTS